MSQTTVEEIYAAVQRLPSQERVRLSLIGLVLIKFCTLLSCNVNKS
jgi:hypothetical protein